MLTLRTATLAASAAQSTASSAVSATLRLLFLASLAGAPTLALANDVHRSVEVTGKAERRVAPDMAVLKLYVLSENAEAAVARREADAVTANALKALRAAGLANADIDTTGLQIAPQYRWLKDARQQELTGYRVTRSIEVRLLDLDALGELLVTLSDTGINRMDSPSLGLQDEERVFQEALAAAAANARERAEVIAVALGAKLGEVVSASTQRGYPERPMLAERAMMAADAAPSSSAESYSAGHVTYSVTINASFSLL